MSNQIFDDLERRVKTTNGKLSSESVTIEGAEVREKIQNLYLYQHVDLQKRLFNFVLWFTTVWSLSVGALLYAKSFNWFGCSLSDWVLCTLLTTTLGTVIGLPLIASSHFFPKKK